MLRIILLLGVLLLATYAQTQSVAARSIASTTYISLSEVSSRLGYSTTDTGNSLTLRSPFGNMVVFENAPDILWRPIDSSEALESSDFSLSAPVLKLEGVWFAPEELFGLLMLERQGNSLRSGNIILNLSFPSSSISQDAGSFVIRDLGNNVPALNFYQTLDTIEDNLSVLLIDLGLLPLVFPEQQRELDTIITRFSQGKPLYIIVSSISAVSWDAQFRFEQASRSLVYRYPNNISILRGDPARVTPDNPVIAIVVLPDEINLRSSLQVTWSNSSAIIQFRR